MYEGLKHFHMMTIAISVVLLSVRFGLIVANSTKVNHPFLKRFPHINDSLLLLSGFGLIAITGFIPFTDAAPWMTEKVTCIMAYFALAFFTIKLAKNNLLRTCAFLGALGWLMMAGKIAMLKTPFLMG
ncbi:SirB2 family protein [Vibrio hangzhouensis]|uniref:SirB2 family protein n=1 Tax=Vibrio hangzhouensis TaxID=462991 RepID=UPI001C954660|nr:SirB2 family protein [Vibrio hangzhouensis]MBY6197661.1 SirB2 family protein [Vibrio hangzhouensis]